MQRKMCVVALLLAVACQADGAGVGVASASTDPPSPPPPPAFENLGQIDGTTWIKHDTARHVTCWEFYYQNDYGTRPFAAGGISCLPDRELLDPPR